VVATFTKSGSVTLTSDLNPSAFGQIVTFTATVTPASATGSVALLDGGVQIGQSPLLAGVAAFVTSALSLGSHTLTAIY